MSKKLEIKGKNHLKLPDKTDSTVCNFSLSVPRFSTNINICKICGQHGNQAIRKGHLFTNSFATLLLTNVLLLLRVRTNSAF